MKMKAKTRTKLVIVDSYLDKRVPCAICGAPILPVLGPQVFLADNLHGSELPKRSTEDQPTGMVCWKCTEKHEPNFNRLLQLGHEAGLFWEQPILALIEGRRASVAPYGGPWDRLWWWEDDKAPRLDDSEDEIVFACGGAFFFPPKRWGAERVEKFAMSGVTPTEEHGWKRAEVQTPTV